MKFQAAVIKEQSVTFAVVVVKKHIIDTSIQANKTILNFQSLFPGIPVVLMTQDINKRPKYYGRRDIFRFLARIPIQPIPWRQYSV